MLAISDTVVTIKSIQPGNTKCIVPLSMYHVLKDADILHDEVKSSNIFCTNPPGFLFALNCS